MIKQHYQSRTRINLDATNFAGAPERGLDEPDENRNDTLAVMYEKLRSILNDENLHHFGSSSSESEGSVNDCILYLQYWLLYSSEKNDNEPPSGFDFDDDPGWEDPKEDPKQEDPKQECPELREQECPEQECPEQEHLEQEHPEQEDPGVTSTTSTSGISTSALLSLSERSDWPPWLTDAIGHLQGISALESWVTLLVSLVKFERSLGFQVTGMSKHDLIDLQNAD